MVFASSPAFSSFAVSDVAAARDFYRDVLGLRVTEQMPGELLRLGIEGGRDVLVYAKADHVPATFTVLSFPVDDVDAAVDALTAAGVTMDRYDGFDQDERGIARGGPGPSIAWFRDPSGNILAVLQE